MFESCVVLDGDKTLISKVLPQPLFESCVVLDGDKTSPYGARHGLCLRVVLF